VRAVVIVARGEQPAALRCESKDGEEIVGISIALGESGDAVGSDVHAVDLDAPQDAGKSFGLLLETLELLIAEKAVPVVRTPIQCVSELDQPLRFCDRQKAQNDRVQQAE